MNANRRARLAACLGLLVFEPRSLLVFWHIGLCLSRALAKRPHIIERRRAPDEYLATWFDTSAAHQPLEPLVSARLRSTEQCIAGQLDDCPCLVQAAHPADPERAQ